MTSKSIQEILVRLNQEKDAAEATIDSTDDGNDAWRAYWQGVSNALTSAINIVRQEGDPSWPNDHTLAGP